VFRFIFLCLFEFDKAHIIDLKLGVFWVLQLLKLDESKLQWYNLVTLSFSTMFSHVDWRKEICLNGLRGLGIWE
jgi:hypothetical protein